MNRWGLAVFAAWTCLLIWLGTTGPVEQSGIPETDLATMEPPANPLHPEETATPAGDEAHLTEAAEGQSVRIRSPHWETNQLTVVEWRYQDSQGHRVEAIGDLDGWGRVYLTAVAEAGGDWSLEEASLFGEYVVANENLPFDRWEEQGLLADGSLEILSTNALCTRIRFNLSTLAEAEAAHLFMMASLSAEAFDRNALVYPSAMPNDPNYSGSWELQKLELEPVWEAYGFSPEAGLGRRAIIAVVDNGAASDDFHYWVNEDEIPGNGIDDDGNAWIDDVHGFNFRNYTADLSFVGSHGNQVAKISAGLTNNGRFSASPASSAALMRVLYFEDNGGNHFAAIDGMLYAVNNGADAVNCSFVSSSSFMFTSVFDAAQQANCVIVVAAGNNNKDLSQSAVYPAYLIHPAMITVGASDSSDNLGNSNYSSTRVDLFAPGGATSYTTPLVTSTVALLRALKPAATYAEIKNAIIQGVDPVPALANLCVSGGRLNVKGAVESLMGVDLDQQNPNPNPPAEPAFSITSIQENAIELSWSCLDAIDGYEVAYSESGGAYLPLEPTSVFTADCSGVLVDGLAASTEYAFRIRSMAGALTSQWVESSPVTTLSPPPVAPPAPQVSVSAVGIGSATLVWSCSEAVELFELQQSVSGGAWSAADPASFPGTSTGGELLGLQEGTEYQFRMRTEREGLSSSWAQTSIVTTEVTPPVAPPAPQVSVSAVGIGSATLDWSCSEAVELFELQQSVSGGAWSAADPASFPGTSTGGELVGLQEGTEYRFRMRTEREGLSSSWAQTSIVTTEVTPPVAPPAPQVSVSAVGIGSATLVWSCSEAVELFELQQSVSGGAWSAADPASFSGASTGGELVGLQEGTEYRFRMRTEREGLSSSWAQTSIVTTEVTPPVAPPAPQVSVSAVGIGSATLVWSCSEAVELFELQQSVSGGAWSAADPASFSGASTGGELLGLQEGTEYRFRMRTEREGLSSSWAQTSIVTTEVTPPVAPVQIELLNAEAMGIGAVFMSWAYSESVDSFEIQMCEDGVIWREPTPPSVSGTERSLLLEGLGSGVQFAFRIRAVRDGLYSKWKQTPTVTTHGAVHEPDPEAPEAPVLIIDGLDFGTASLSWSTAETVDGFRIEATLMDSVQYAPVAPQAQFSGEMRTAQIDSLQEGEIYRFRIQAFKDDLGSAWAYTVPVEIPRQPDTEPQAPDAPLAVAHPLGLDSFDLSWSLAGPADHVHVEISAEGMPFALLEPESQFSPDVSSLLVTGLAPDTAYVFRLRAVSEGMYSDWSYTDEARTYAPLILTPPTPTLSIEEQAGDAVRLSWSSATPVDAYQLEVSVDGFDFDAVEPAGPIDPATTSMQIEGLELGSTYSFRLRSVRKAVASAWAQTDLLEVPECAWLPGLIDGELPEPVNYWNFEGLNASYCKSVGALSTEVSFGTARVAEGINGPDSGLRMEGSHSGVVIPNCTALNKGAHEALSISLWVRLDPEAKKATSVIYEQGGYWRGLNILVERGWVQVNGWNRPESESGWAGTTLQGGKLKVGEWHHIALVLDAGLTIGPEGLKLFVNGQLKASGAASRLWIQDDQNRLGQVGESTYFRGRQVLALDPFQGNLDEFAVWNHALSETEITRLIFAAFPEE